jgi:hypothetical protein
MCGVLGDEAAGTFGDAERRRDAYMIAKGC